MTSATVSSLVHATPASAISALSTTDLASLTSSDIESLSQSQIQAFTAAQVAAIPVAVLSSAIPVFSEFASTQIASLTTSEIQSLNSTQISSLSPVKLAAMSAAQVSAIAASSFGAINRRGVANLTTGQLSNLSEAQVLTFTAGKLSTLTGDQIAAIAPANLAALGAHRIGSLNTTQLESLTTSQIAALSKNEILAISSNINVLNTTQISAINLSIFDKLGSAFISTIDPTSISWDQYFVMSSTTISGLTTQFFSHIPNIDFAAITTTAIVGVTTTQLQSLSGAQLMEFETPQIAAMGADQQAIINNVNPYLVEAGSMASNGVLTYNDALTILEGAASTDMNSTKFAQLQAFANKLQDFDDVVVSGIDDAIQTWPAVKQFFDNVVLGNVENENWYGGAAQPTQLGNLTSTSTSGQFNALIDKWFLGADMPGSQTDASGDTFSSGYQQSTLPLYGPSGAPQLQDIIQGSVQDSALLAGIAETAIQDPSYLAGLITDNGNGTYTVALPAAFGNTYVTVNDQLPGAGEAATANASTGIWVALLEKAAAENIVNISAADGNQQNILGNTYAALTLDTYSDDLFSLYSGGQMFSDQMFAGQSQSQIDQELANYNTGIFAIGDPLIFQRGNEYYAVTGINASAGTIDVYDSVAGKNTTLTVSSSSSMQDQLYAADMDRALIR